MCRKVNKEVRKENRTKNMIMAVGTCEKMRADRHFCVLLFDVLILGMLLLTSCGVPDRALVLSGDDTGKTAVQDDEQNGVDGSVLENHSVDGTVDGVDGQSRQTDSASGTGESAEQQTILVYVCGAVVNPGVVELPVDSRAADALEVAGGMLEEAQPDYVNLAAKLEDAQKLYFPTKDEAEELLQEEIATASGLVNINTANIEQLCTLPGIGEARARDIVAYREENGPFQSKEDIMNVSGIKQNAYNKLKEQITVD